MNRRRLLTTTISAALATRSRPSTAQTARPAFVDLLDLDPARVDELSIRTFQMPATASLSDQVNDLYWVAALGIVTSADTDIDHARDGAVESFPAWYVASTTMTLGPNYEASLGGQTVGDGSAAWYRDVTNPDDPDPSWRTFAIGCTAVWSDRRLLLLWGASASRNPVIPLIDLAATVHPAWGPDAASLVPTIADLPIGMVVIDEGPLHLPAKRPRPGHGNRHPGHL